MEDRQILRLLLDRREEGLAAADQKYGKSLQSLAMNILADKQDAQECVNDTYLALWNTVPPKEPDPLGGYLHRIGRNLAITKLRANLAQKRNGSYDVALEELSHSLSAGTMEDQTQVRELGRAINGFLKTCTKENRILFLRRYWYGDGLEDLAQKTGLSIGSLSVRLFRLREKLKKYLIKEGIFL